MHDLRFSSTGHHTALGSWLRAGPDNPWSLWYLNKRNVSVPRVPTLMPQNRWMHGTRLGYAMGLDNSNRNLSCSKGKVCETTVLQSITINAGISKTHKKVSPDFTKRTYNCITSLLRDAPPLSKSPPGCTMMITFVVSNPELKLYFPLPSWEGVSHSKVDWLISSQSPGFVHRTWNRFESHHFTCLDPWTTRHHLFGTQRKYQISHKIHHWCTKNGPGRNQMILPLGGKHIGHFKRGKICAGIDPMLKDLNQKKKLLPRISWIPLRAVWKCISEPSQMVCHITCCIIDLYCSNSGVYMPLHHRLMHLCPSISPRRFAAAVALEKTTGQ